MDRRHPAKSYPDYQERQKYTIERLAKPKASVQVARKISEQRQKDDLKKKHLPYIQNNRGYDRETAEAMSDRLYRNAKRTMFPSIWESNLIHNLSRDHAKTKTNLAFARNPKGEPLLPSLRDNTRQRKISNDAQEITNRLYTKNVRGKPFLKLQQSRRIQVLKR